MKEILCVFCGNPVEPSELRTVGQDYHEECKEDSELYDKVDF